MSGVSLANCTTTVPKALRADLAANFAEVLKRTDLGFWQMPNRPNLLQAVEVQGSQLRLKFCQLVVIGIGGSSLGGRTLCAALLPQVELAQIHFIDHLDQHGLKETLTKIGALEHVAWAIVSKSGRTMETLAVVEWLQALSQNSVKFTSQNTIVVTELRKNPLYDWAQSREITTLEIPLDVGGRFSVFTAAGLLPFVFGKGDVQRLITGAQRAIASPDVWIDLAVQSVASWQRNEWLTLFWAYVPRLENLGFWYQQLWAESLAKSVDRNDRPATRVSTPLPLVGPRDQHSVLQQVMEGYNDKFVWFVRDRESESDQLTLKSQDFGSALDFMVDRGLGRLLAAEAQATSQALNQSGVQSLCLELDGITPESIGEILMGLQLTVAALGEYLGINAFNQPGVELGKVLAQKVLKSE